LSIIYKFLEDADDEDRQDVEAVCRQTVKAMIRDLINFKAQFAQQAPRKPVEQAELSTAVTTQSEMNELEIEISQAMPHVKTDKPFGELLE